MLFYNKDPKRHHNFDNHPNISRSLVQGSPSVADSKIGGSRLALSLLGTLKELLSELLSL